MILDCYRVVGDELEPAGAQRAADFFERWREGMDRGDVALVVDEHHCVIYVWQLNRTRAVA